MPSWHDFQPFIVTGLALGGVYALSGVGMVVLYRTTGVLNLAFGAVGAMARPDRLGPDQQLRCGPNGRHTGWPFSFAAGVTLLYGVLLGPALARRDPLVKATATLGLALILLGTMSWIWSDKARSQVLPTSTHAFDVGQVAVTWTQVIAFGLGVVVIFGTAAFLRYTKLGTAMRGLANDREITATLGVPVRRVEAQAWLVSGPARRGRGAAALGPGRPRRGHADLPGDLVPGGRADRAAADRSSSRFFAALVVGLVNALVTPITSISEYRDMTPFVLAIIALLVISRQREISFTGTGLGNGRRLRRRSGRGQGGAPSFADRVVGPSPGSSGASASASR